ncbi:B-cell receptor CD22-like [Polypterus senegalus]|uniref:B-cell receptor CD22-like n=1 Tax=Polypterus senegalus TaxID=55291 RepID=UPI0019627BE8|nr:B-cell receptor CD22-like [Polypterus senegalus]
MLLLIFVAAVSSVADLSDWRVSYETKKICTKERSTLTIKCSYSHPEGVTIEKEMWFYGPDENKSSRDGETTVYHTDAKEVSTSHKDRVKFSGDKNKKTCSVAISNVSKQDSGYYKFRLEGAGEQGHATGVPGVNVTVTDVSEWQAKYDPNTICAVERSTVRMNCTLWLPECMTIEKEMWTYGPDKNKIENDGETLVYHTDKSHVSSTHRNRVQFLGNRNKKTCSVEISDVQREESGYYKYKFERESLWAVVSGVNVTITGLNVEATAETVKENDTVTLRCRMNCSLTIAWFRNGRHLDEATEELKIQRASHEDHGSYSCRVGHIASPEVQLNVEYAPKNVVITGQPSSYIEVGTSVTLNCTALANPSSNYTWVKENISQVGSGEQLHINEFNRSHTGSYHCEAINIYGMSKSAAVNLMINEIMLMNYVLYGSLSVVILSACALQVFIFLRKRAQKTNQQNGVGKMTEGVNSFEDQTYASLDLTAVSSDYDTIIPKKRSNTVL